MLEKEVQSPCIKICDVDKEHHICTGCYRSTDEISMWKGAGNRERKEILKAVEARKFLIFKSK
jgi:uncharacterized protein